MFRLFGIILAGMFLTQSCSESCTCTKQCAYFDHDSIEICSMSYPYSFAYLEARDSMERLYGTRHDTILDMQKLQGVATRLFESKVSNLKSQGYQCECAK